MVVNIISEAKATLSALLRKAPALKEAVIARAGKPHGDGHADSRSLAG